MHSLTAISVRYPTTLTTPPAATPAAITAGALSADKVSSKALTTTAPIIAHTAIIAHSLGEIPKNFPASLSGDLPAIDVDI